MKRKYIVIIVSMLLILILPYKVLAQESGENLHLGLTRNFGYGGFGKIQGTFTIKIVNPPVQLEKVEFYLDEELIFTASEESYKYQIHTSDYPDGEHSMYALGYLADGSILESNHINTDFLSSEQAWGETQGLLGPILIGTAVLTLLGIGVPLLFNKQKNFVLGKYGPAGGAVCPRCNLPFSRHFLSPNLLIGKLVRCPHCGKISIQPSASHQRLKEAEGRYANQDPTVLPPSSSDDLSKLIEESRFDD
jgi:hypothetical protein